VTVYFLEVRPKMADLKDRLKRLSPRLYRALSRGNQWLVRQKRRTLWRASAKPVEKNDISTALGRQGTLSAGDIVMVHSSLSTLGRVEGGAEAVCDALLRVLGDEGTLLMPSYHQPEPVLQMIHDCRPVDLRVAPSTVGKLTEVFRRMPGVRRSSHPFCSVSARGRFALEMTSSHASSVFMCGPGTPTMQLVERKAKYMGIGVDIRIVALYHALEENWSGFPRRVHCLKPFLVRYTDADGIGVEREIAVLDPAASVNRIDQEGRGAGIRRFLTNHMLARGILKTFFLGQASCWFVDSEEFYNEIKALAADGITIYTTTEELSRRRSRAVL
jgi:aminoglycoside 3-N-acetyltransferase